MKPILFLDLDDVLCLNTSFGARDAISAARGCHSNPQDVWRDLFDPTAVGVLRRLHHAMTRNLRYVISSTWREYLHRHEMGEVFRQTGLRFLAEALEPGKRWRTPSPWDFSDRAGEIAAWLDLYHESEPFAIVDDRLSGLTLQPSLELETHCFFGRVVLCQESVGLQEKHLPPLTSALCRLSPNLGGVIHG